MCVFPPEWDLYQPSSHRYVQEEKLGKGTQKSLPSWHLWLPNPQHCAKCNTMRTDWCRSFGLPRHMSLADPQRQTGYMAPTVSGTPKQRGIKWLHNRTGDSSVRPRENGDTTQCQSPETHGTAAGWEPPTRSAWPVTPVDGMITIVCTLNGGFSKGFQHVCVVTQIYLLFLARWFLLLQRLILSWCMYH